MATVLTFHLRLGLPKDLFPSCPSTKILYAFVDCSKCASCLDNGLVGWSRTYALLAHILTIINTLFSERSQAKPLHGTLSNNTTRVLWSKWGQRVNHVNFKILARRSSTS